ncbi:hypothetical protein RB195_011813 [Necator americanus]|uniref:Secreted protein n=1 Tax=Necator americanus TaxID=51031 RepID=A0ABR1D5T2_NECAM
MLPLGVACTYSSCATRMDSATNAKVPQRSAVAQRLHRQNNQMSCLDSTIGKRSHRRFRFHRSYLPKDNDIGYGLRTDVKQT